MDSTPDKLAAEVSILKSANKKLETENLHLRRKVISLHSELKTVENALSKKSRSIDAETQIETNFRRIQEHLGNNAIGVDKQSTDGVSSLICSYLDSITISGQMLSLNSAADERSISLLPSSPLYALGTMSDFSNRSDIIESVLRIPKRLEKEQHDTRTSKQFLNSILLDILENFCLNQSIFLSYMEILLNEPLNGNDRMKAIKILNSIPVEYFNDLHDQDIKRVLKCVVNFIHEVEDQSINTIEESSSYKNNFLFTNLYDKAAGYSSSLLRYLLRQKVFDEIVKAGTQRKLIKEVVRKYAKDYLSVVNIEYLNEYL